MTERAAARLPHTPDVLELDANRPEDYEALAAGLRERWGGVDGALHAIAFAPADALGGGFLDTPTESAGAAFTTSAYSLKALAGEPAPAVRGRRRGRLDRGDGLRRLGGLAGLRLDGRGQGGARGHRRATWRATWAPHGVRVNLVSAGSAPHPRGRRHRRASRGWPAPGRSRRRSAGTPATPGRWPTPPASCSPISRARSAARSSTWTAASTPWARRSTPATARAGREPGA